MSKKSPPGDKGIMESLTGIRRMKQDKIDLHQNIPRKKPVVKTHIDSNLDNISFSSISHNIPATIRESWFHHGMQKKLMRKIKMGQLTIDAVLDLHGHRKQQATQELELFMQYAINGHSRQLLIIHGKGFNSQSEAVLRPLVQHWLSEQEMVLAYCPAQPRDGGAGASYVYLKNRN